MKKEHGNIGRQEYLINCMYYNKNTELHRGATATKEQIKRHSKTFIIDAVKPHKYFKADSENFLRKVHLG